jgi:hypothetical protein
MNRPKNEERFLASLEMTDWRIELRRAGQRCASIENCVDELIGCLFGESRMNEPV